MMSASVFAESRVASGQFITASTLGSDKVRHHFESIGEDKTWILALSWEQLKSNDFTVILDE